MWKTLNDFSFEKMSWKRLYNDDICDLKIYLKNIINENINKKYNIKVFIGSDSQLINDNYIFGTVIILRLFKNNSVGNGCIVLFTKLKSKYNDSNLTIRERMLIEAHISVEVAYNISEILGDFNIPMEVHVDVNPNTNFESNKSVNEVVGYIMGMGFDCKIKPNAWAASCGADKIIKI